MPEVIIIGAGMAGLSAALELKKRSISYVLLEAADEVGGRARTLHLPSGVDADLGAHWMHGEGNPLGRLVREYGIRCHKDKAAKFIIFEKGMRREVGADWLEQAVDPDLANWIRRGEELDRPLPDLGRDEESRKTLLNFGRLWNCIDPPIEPSAREFLTDENTPGGLQPEGGMQSLTAKMAADAGFENIHLNTTVTVISAGAENVRVETAGGGIWDAKQALFTGSLGVLNNGMITFDPPLSDAFRAHLAGLVMGTMDKIILELDPEFFEERGIAPDMAVELLEETPPHFCHIRSAGAPLVTLFIAGERAKKIENFTSAEALAYARHVLSPVEELKGFEERLASPPVVTNWSSNPYARGAYSSCLPGHRRSGPWAEGKICFCGDTFDERFPASLAGAFLSGQKAAQQLFH